MSPARRILPSLALAGILLGSGVLAPPTARADVPPACPLGLTSKGETTPADGGTTFEVCGGKVRTFDGTPLQVDVSLPTVPVTLPGATAPPLILFMSGWSNDYCQFESTTQAGAGVAGCGDYIGNPGYHWNNAWFASRGYVTINYTPRGWYNSCGKVLSTGYTYVTDATCSDTPGEQSWVHLYDRRFEIRDAQYLSGLLVDAGKIDPNHVVATGDSGGGGPSWDLALSQDNVVQLNSTPSMVNTAPWTSPGASHTPLHLAAALPLYTWTDLADSLMPNGTSSDGFGVAPADGTHTVPIGVEKQTYVVGLFAKGLSNVPSEVDHSAQFVEAPNSDPSADLTKWFTEINAGEPTFSVNPDAQFILQQIGGALRSPFAIPVPPVAGEKPIFVTQGITDPLFPGLQPLTMIKRLKNADPNYPVWAFLGDVGHSYAQNPLDVWQQAHNESNAWLDAELAGQQPAQPPVTIDTTRCVGGQTLSSFTGTTLGAIPTTQLVYSSAAPRNTVNSNAPSYEGAQTDPIANGGCRTITASQLSANAANIPPQAVYTFPAVTSTVTLVGGPTVQVNAAVAGSSAELASRLWDVDAAGNQTLITRNVYRIDNGTAPSSNGIIKFQLWPNCWQLQTGHSIKLELTQDDSPVWRPDNEPSSITLTNMILTLPVVSGSGVPPTDVPEAPLAATLPLAALPIAAMALLARRRRRSRA